MAVERATIEQSGASSALPFNLAEAIRAIEVDEVTEGGILPLVSTPPDEFLDFGSGTFPVPTYTAPSLTLGYTIVEPDHT